MSIDEFLLQKVSILSALPKKKKQSCLSVESLKNSIELLCKIAQAMLDNSDQYISPTKLDAAVCDGQCQIRALITILIYQLPKDSIDFIRINIMLKKLELTKEKINSVTDVFCLEEFLSENDIVFLIPNYMLFLGVSGFIAQYNICDSYGFPVSIDLLEMRIGEGFSSIVFTKRVAHAGQRWLADFSCDVIAQLANLRQLYTREFIELFIEHDEVKRKTFPGYLSTELLLESFKILDFQCYMVVIDNANIKRMFYLENKVGRERISLVNSTQVDIFGIIFSGRTTCDLGAYTQAIDFGKKINCIGFSNVIMMNMAQHKQYPGMTSPKLFINKMLSHLVTSYRNCNYWVAESIVREIRLFERRLSDAADKGFCLTNSAVFLLNHVYTDGLCNYQKLAARKEAA